MVTGVQTCALPICGAYKKYYNRYGKKYGDYYGAYYGGNTTEKKAGIKE